MDKVETTIEAASGYLQLGMPDDAQAELDTLPAAEQHQPDVLRLKIEICINRQDWDKGIALGREMQERLPDAPAAYILSAYCLRELDKVGEARELLVSGPESLRAEPIFYYNLACYESLLGELESAGDWLLRAFDLDDNLRSEARSDRDLENLRKVAGDDFMG